MTDFYEILGVPRSASAGEIKKAYRALASRYHPDKHRGNELEDLAKEKLKALNEAYEILSNPEKRARYDAARAQGGGRVYSGHGPGPAGVPEPDMSRAVWSFVRFLVVLAIVFFAMRFVRSPRAIAVVAAAILVAWFAPRLFRRIRKK
jgi:curved DNA-binding protein CbpA